MDCLYCDMCMQDSRPSSFQILFWILMCVHSRKKVGDIIKKPCSETLTNGLTMEAVITTSSYDFSLFLISLSKCFYKTFVSLYILSLCHLFYPSNYFHTSIF